MPTHSISAVIIRTEGGEPLFTLQRKTPGYPFANFTGNLFPFGGFRDDGDPDPLATLQRELPEEFPDEEYRREVLGRLRPYGTFLSQVTHEIHGHPKRGDMEVEFSLYDALLSPGFVKRRPDTVRELHVEEGEAVHLPYGNLRGPVFAWGTDQMLKQYLDEQLGYTFELQGHNGIVVARTR